MVYELRLFVAHDNDSPTARYGDMFVAINTDVDVAASHTPEKMAGSSHFITDHKPSLAKVNS